MKGPATRPVTGPDSFRVARPDDHARIDSLLRGAFSGPQEAALMHELRAQGRIETEVVMPFEDAIVAHLALSWLVEPAGWLALAPVSVAPEWQGKGLGTRLVAGVLRLAAIKGQSVVVIGRASFYKRAGFSQDRAARLAIPYPLAVTLLSRPGEDVPKVRVIYPDAFARV
jgi:putative acetyltransferase